MVEPDGHNLVFILSAPRSGSTLFGALLGSHTQILCPPEPWLLLPLANLRARNILVVAGYDHELARKALEELTDDATFWHATSAFATTVYNRLLQPTGKTVFLDKTPRYYQILPCLDAVFPKALRICLSRNPLDVIASCKATWNLSVAELLGQPLTPHTFDTTVSFFLLAAYSQRSAVDTIAVRYEDLVRDPAAPTQNICRRLGLPFEPGMLEYGSNSALLQSYARASFGDRKVLAYRQPHSESVGCWRDILTPAEVRCVLTTLGTDVFRQLGYAESIEEACARSVIRPDELTSEGDLPRLHEQYTSYLTAEVPRSAGIKQTLARKNYRLQLMLGKCQADRAARLDVINRLDAQVSELRAQLAASEANRLHAPWWRGGPTNRQRVNQFVKWILRAFRRYTDL